MLMIAEALQRSGIRLRGDLILKSVVEDEESGNGTLACLERGFGGDAAMVLDGTWPERYIVSHIGHVWFEVVLEGRGAPSSVASRGLNPLRGVGPLTEAFEAFVHRRNARDGRAWGAQREPYFVNLGRIEGGDYPGSVPRSCRIEGHYGFLPPTTPDEARAELEDLLDGLAQSPSWPLEAPPRIHFYGAHTPAFAGRADSELTRLLRGTVQRLRQREVIDYVITGWCDLRHYESNPWFGPIPTCLYGPGGGANAHIEDEYYLLEHLVPVAQNVASVAVEWCG
jgi:acetylornithine deacetylase